MNKVKKTIGASLSLALILASMPGGAFAQNIRAAAPAVGTQAGGIAGLSSDHQVQFAASINALILPLSYSASLGSEEVVDLIGKQISQPGATPMQVAAGKTTLAALADPDAAARAVADLEKISHAGFPKVGKQAAEALAGLARKHSSQATRGVAARAVAALDIDSNVVFDGLAAGAAADKTLFKQALEVSDMARAEHLAAATAAVRARASYGLEGPDPIFESRLVHHAIVQAVVARGNKSRADVLDLAGRFVDLPKETKESIVEDSVANLVRLIGDKIDPANSAVVREYASRLKMSTGEFTRFMSHWDQLSAGGYATVKTKILEMMDRGDLDFITDLKRAHKAASGFKAWQDRSLSLTAANKKAREAKAENSIKKAFFELSISLRGRGSVNRETVQQETTVLEPRDVFDEEKMGVSARFIKVEPGTFQMGSPDDEEGRWKEEVPHTVTISRPFMLQADDVTQGQFLALRGHNPSYFTDKKHSDGDYRVISGKGHNLKHPVENVSWYDGAEYANAMSKLEGLPPAYEIFKNAVGKPTGARVLAPSIYEARGYRLATEAEMEYAARAGTTTPYPFKGQLDDNAHYAGNSGGRTHAVGMTRPNAWGFHNMVGNVWKWTHDWWGNHTTDAVTDPQGAVTGSNRVVRGGSWYSDARCLRSAVRSFYAPGNRYEFVGFRLARSIF